MQRDGPDTNSTDRGRLPAPPSPENVASTQDVEVSGGPARGSIESQPTVVSSRPPLPGGYDNPLLETEQALSGKTLAHFQLLELIGGGGMGVVFQALDTMLQRIVAVKVLSPDQARDKDTVRRFRNEAQSAARLDHDNIARVYYVGEQDGWSFIVLEYIAGLNVRDLVAQNGPFGPEQAFHVTLQLAEALEHASKREVVHRDIKPSNVLLTPDGRAKLVDMGLARLQRIQSPSDDLTATGVTLGTFDYISPEQARDPRTADVRSDMYSLGCTLFFMLTGRPPFPDGTVLQKLLSHSSDAPPDPRQWRDDLPPELIAILNRLLSKRPEDRYQEPSELIGELILTGERLGWKIATRGEPIFISPRNSRFGWAERHLPWIVPTAVFFIFMVFLYPIWESSQTSAASDATFILPEERADAVNPVRADGHFQSGDDTDRVAADGNESRIRAPATTNDGTGDSSSEQSLTNDVAKTPEAVSEVTADSSARTSDARPDEVGKGGQNTLIHRVVVSNDSKRSRNEDGSRVFDSLRLALSYARGRANIQKIELQFNGYMDAADLMSVDQPLTIAAAPGFRPTLMLQAESSSDSTALNSLIRMEGGSLTLENIHLEMRIPIDTISQRWSVFRLSHPTRIVLQNCAITVRNSRGGRQSFLDYVAVFDVAGDSETDDMLNPVSEDPSATTYIQLQNCAVRGEATLVRADSAVPIDLSWHNGLFVSTERLLTVHGSAEEFDQASQRVDVELDHLTSILDKGLIQFTTSAEVPFLPRCAVRASDCIFVCTPWSSFISHAGPYQAHDADNLLSYYGARNRYQGLLTYWKISSGNGPPLKSLTFHDWRQAAQVEEEDSTERPVVWSSPPRDDVPVHTHRLTHYELVPDHNAGTGTDGTENEPGMRASRTAQFPSQVNEIIQRNLFLPF
jgi:serine/threonine-protein kinase